MASKKPQPAFYSGREDGLNFAVMDKLIAQAAAHNVKQPDGEGSSWYRQGLGDKALGFASGAVGATQALSNLAGADNAASKALGGANKGIESYLSPEAKAAKLRQAELMESARAKGFNLDGAAAGLEAFAQAPIQTMIEGAGSIAPIAATALAGVPAAVATGIGMGAGGSKGAIFDEIKNRGTKAGLSEEEATAQAIEAQSYFGKNADQIAIGGALGAADSLTGAGKIASSMLRNAVLKPAAKEVAKKSAAELLKAPRGLFGRTAMGVAGEVPLEMAQGGQEQVAANLAAQRAGYEAGTWDKVASKAIMEGLASAGPGGAFGAMNTGPKPVTPAVDPAIAAAKALADKAAAEKDAAIKANAASTGVIGKASTAAHAAMGNPSATRQAPELTPDQKLRLATLNKESKSRNLNQSEADEFNSLIEQAIAYEDQQEALQSANIPHVDAGSSVGDGMGGTPALPTFAPNMGLPTADQIAADQAANPNAYGPSLQQGGLPLVENPTVKESLTTQTEPEAPDAPAQQVEQYEPAQAGDILNMNGKPFKKMETAMMRQRRLGDGHEVVRVDGGLAIRPKATEVPALPAQSDNVDDAGGGIERYQWQRNAEGGQERGNQQTIQPLTEALFNEHVAPKVAVKSFSDYQQQFPAATHISLVQKADGGVELGAGGVGPIDKLRPSAAPVENGWVKAVDSFDSPEAVAHGGSADSDPMLMQPTENLEQVAKNLRSSAREMRKNANGYRERGNAEEAAAWLAQAKEKEAHESRIQAEIKRRGGVADVEFPSQKKPLAGQSIDKDWTAFHPESGTLNVPRAEMPQIKSGHRGAMVNFLKARGIDSTQEEVPTESLKPTQTEFSPEKVEKAKGFKGGDRSILVSSDGYVLDGHHQWVAKHEAGEPVKVIRLDAPIDALLSAVREFPSAETTVNSTNQEKANEKTPKTEQDSAEPEAATSADTVNASEPDQPAAEQAGASSSEVDLKTVEGVARAVQLKVAANRRKFREKSRKEREAKGYAPNSTPESEKADYEAEISGPPSDLQKQSAAAMLGTDPLPLIRMFVHGQYEASEDVFKAIAGVKIRGLSDVAKKAALYQWAKWTPEQIAQAEGDAQARKDEAAEKQRQDDLKSAVMGTWLGLDRLKVKEKDGTESTGQEFVLRSVVSGFDKAHAQKKGAATVYGLTDGARFISLKAKPFTEFVKAAIAYGGLDKSLAYANPPKPQAPEGFVDRSIATADKAAEQPVPTVSQDSFIKTANGSIDFGEITPEIAKVIGRQAGKIRLQQGIQNPDGTGYGLAHIEARHGKQIRDIGFADIAAFVEDSVKNFDEIWKPGATSQIVAIVSDKKGRAIYLQLSPAKDADGDFYRVNSAFPVGPDYAHKKEEKEGWKPLWSGHPVPADASGASSFVGQSPNAGGTAPMVSSQGGDESVTQAAESSKRPKNWDKNYGSASKIAQAIGIALRGSNGKMKKVPELVADIKAADAAASAAAQDADLSKSQPKVDTTAEPVQKPQESEQVDAAQAEWTRTRDVDRMAMMLKLGYSEEVARRTAGKSWENVGSVFKAKLAKAMAEPLTTVAPTAPTGEDALYTSTAKLTQPYTLDDFIGNVDAGYRAHFDYAGADGRTLWIERVDGGWVLKSKDDDSTTTITKGGAGIGGRWSKGEALRAAEDDAKYRYTEWKPVVPKAPDATQTPKETTSETARKAEFALKDGTRAKVVENATRGVFTVSVANAKGENFESYGTFQMDDQFGISRVAARANWAMDAVREASYQFVLQQKEQAEKKPADQKSKPRLGESAAEVEQKFKKEAQALHYLEGHGMVPVVARNPAGGETYTFAPNTGTLSVVLDGGARIRPASRNEKSTFAAELSRDQLQITANSRWGGSGSKTGSKVLAVLHSPSGNSFQKFESSSPAVQDFIDGKRDDAPTIEEVKAELSPLTKARNFLMELEAKLEGQGRVVDDRLVQMIRQQKDVIKELEAEQGKAQDLPSQEASNTIQSSPSEDAITEAKATIESLDAQIKRHEELLGCLG